MNISCSSEPVSLSISPEGEGKLTIGKFNLSLDPGEICDLLYVCDQVIKKIKSQHPSYDKSQNTDHLRVIEGYRNQKPS
ncbi:MAG: hypothetical protein HRU19_07120 [Pseudobacteriovorax sp.]|nr:hypothetical protein [Pseudobacteriovorax sp.]